MISGLILNQWIGNFAIRWSMLLCCIFQQCLAYFRFDGDEKPALAERLCIEKFEKCLSSAVMKLEAFNVIDTF